MITIIHGEDTVSSRNYLLDLKKNNPENHSFDKENLTLQNLIQVLKGSNLFNEGKTVFIENFFASKNADSKKIIELVNASRGFNIYFWEGNEIGKTNLSVFKNADVKIFKIPQNMFAFLDNIKPNNKNNLSAFHNTLTNSDPEMIFYMITRQFRLLIALSDGSNSIEETARLAPWQKDKLQRQAKMFSSDQLKKNYNKLFEIDLSVKSGQITNLSDSIDIFLLDL